MLSHGPWYCSASRSPAGYARKDSLRWCRRRVSSSATKPGKTLRSVIEISNRSTTPGKYVVHTADWDLSADFSVTFHDDLQPGSCRPWVAIERPDIVVPGAGTMRYRFEVSVPADAPPGECRFAVMIEGAEPSIARSQGLNVPVTGRIGVIVYVIVGDGSRGARDPRTRCGNVERTARTHPARAQRRQRPRAHERLSHGKRCQGFPTTSRPRTSRSCRTRSGKSS